MNIPDIISSIYTIIWWYAAYLIVNFIIKCLYFFYRHFIRKRHDLLKRYGKDSWVLVTGATDGIGKGLAIHFAQTGFNIILVARNQEKLKLVSDEIKEITNNKVLIKTLTFDFSSKYTETDYLEAFKEILANYDVSVLINNVGTATTNTYRKLTGKQIQDMINVNIVPHAILTTLFKNNFSKRSGLKSAIIDLSSFFSQVQASKFFNYCAGKAFNNHFSKITHFELKNFNIDTLSVMPMWVETPLTRCKANWYHTITVDALCKAILDQVGHDYETFGHMRHEFQGRIWLSCFPNFYARRFRNTNINSDK